MEAAKQAAADARKTAMSYTHGIIRSETSMATTVRDIIDTQVIRNLNLPGAKFSDVTVGHIDGAMACIKRVVARESATRAVARYQARLRRLKPRHRTWDEVDRAAHDAIAEVRKELGSEAFS